MNGDVMGSSDAIFPTFFMTGFECSTFVWKDRERKDYVTATGHDVHLERDLSFAMDLGMGVAREAIRWPQVVVRVLDGRHLEPAPGKERNEALDQRRLAGVFPADDADEQRAVSHAHAPSRTGHAPYRGRPAH